jgi:hypothetical protein
MPITKITLSTAMRARDVSRPREGHLAEAAGREDALTRQAEPPPPKPVPPAPASAPATQPNPTVPAGPAAPPPRRRRRRRS